LHGGSLKTVLFDTVLRREGRKPSYRFGEPKLQILLNRSFQILTPEKTACCRAAREVDKARPGEASDESP
jgi:hypothetical protein